MGLAKEFREFALKGNVVDMAVGVIIGAGFGKIVSSLVADIIMPPIGIILGGVNFTNLRVNLKDAGGTVPAVTLNYGQFIQTVFDFSIIAFAMFTVIKIMNRMKKSDATNLVEPTKQETLLTEIRDLLKSSSR